MSLRILIPRIVEGEGEAISYVDIIKFCNAIASSPDIHRGHRNDFDEKKKKDPQNYAVV